MTALLFILFAGMAVGCAVSMVAQRNPLYGAISLIGVFISLACLYVTLAAPFIAAVQVIVYAGAIMVLFVFVVMLLNRGPQTVAEERQWLVPQVWVGPAVLAVILIGELVYVLNQGAAGTTGAQAVDSRQVGIALFGPYLLGTELASMLLLAGLVGAYHLGRREKKEWGGGDS